MRRLWYAVLLLIPLLGATALARAQQPLTTQLTPDLRVYPQFFAAAQGADGDLYVGGLDGVLRFDGGRWHWLELPRPGPVRALHTGRDGRIWVGATNSFGYLERDAAGAEHFVDLAPRFAKELAGHPFADIWRIAEGDGEIWFGALQDLFVVSRSGEAQGYWHHDGRFGGMRLVGGQVWVQWRGEGLKRFEAGTFKPLPGGERFAQALVYSLFVRGDGSVVVHDARPSLSVWQDGQFVDRTTPQLATQIADTQAGLMIDDDHLALAGGDGTLCVVDLANAQSATLRLGQNFLSDILRGQDGALYAVDGSFGILRLDWPPHWRQWQSDSLRGVYKIAEFDGALYIATTNGAFRVAVGGPDAAPTATPLGWTQNEAWAFHRHGERLLFAESKRLFEIVQDAPQAISADDLYPRTLLDDPLNPDLLWVGTEHGVALFEHAASGYRLLQRDFRLGWSVRSLVAHDGAIWAADDTDGVFRLRRDDRAAPAAVHFAQVGTEAGLPPAPLLPSAVSLLDGQLYASTSRGLFRYAGGRFGADRADGLADLLDERERVEFRNATDGGAWAFSFHSIYRRDTGGHWQRSLLGGLRTGAILDLLPRRGGEAWVAGEAGMLRHVDTNAAGFTSTEPRPRVAAAQLVQRDGVVQTLPLDRSPALYLNGGGLQFEFAYPRLDGGGGEFQFTIDADGRNWSAWSNRASAAFFALPPGEYRLRLRARSRYASAVEADPFAFTIVPRWFERSWVWPLAAFLVASLIALAQIRRQRNKVRRLRAQNLELDRLVRARTRDLELANVQLRGLADSDGLTGLANRRHFDGVLGSAVAQARERHEALSLLMIDVDHFKRYNDDHGHQAGDDVLRALAAVMRECVRPDTLTARYGGEEFAVIAPHCDRANAREIAERIRQGLVARLPNVTLSIGIATREPHSEAAASDLVAYADAALYRAKRDGRDRVEQAPVAPALG